MDTVRLIALKPLKEHYEKAGREDSKQPLLTWAQVVKHAAWETPADIKQDFGTADLVGDNRVVFNTGGNKYRLVASVHFAKGIVWVIWVGAHEEYDRIDVRTVKYEKGDGDT